jgi:AcrR family transcriptional regulator
MTTSDTRLTRGERTRERLRREALRLFAIKGPEAVGTRELAGAAGTNIASIAFHFGGKEGLYAAVIEDVAGELARLHRTALGAAEAESDAAGEGARARARRVVEKLVLALLTSNRSQWMSLLLQREFITPTASFARIYAEAVEPTLTAISRLVAAATGQDGPSMDNTVLSFSLFIMASAFSRNRNTFLRFAGQTEYTPQDIAAIARVVSGFVENGLAPRP